MQRFRFSLETLLELRRRKEEEAKLALGRKQEEVRQGVASLDELSEQLKQLQAEQKEARGDKANVDLWRRGVAYRHKLKRDILAQGRHNDDLRAEAEGLRKALVKATQKVRALEMLRERRLAQWRKQARAEEQEFSDDVSGQGYIRKKKQASRSSV